MSKIIIVVGLLNICSSGGIDHKIKHFPKILLKLKQNLKLILKLKPKTLTLTLKLK